MKPTPLSPQERREQRERLKSKRERGQFPHARQRRSGVHYLDEPRPVIPGSALRVIGVADDAPEHLKAQFGVGESR